MAEMSLSSTIPMNNGVDIPVLGLGVFKVPDREAYGVVSKALEIGYRHIDTAAYYQNERGVGRAIRDSGLAREEVFVTTKLWYTDNSYSRALDACDRSLEALGMDYVDLYLVHWPRGDRDEAWRAMERILDEGKARAVGVSNYLIRHLDGIASHSAVVPAIDQVEFSPFLYQKELLSYCRDKGIVLEAYSPLTRGRRLDDPRLVEMARKYGRTPAQLLIRWVLQKGMVAIPKSVHEERMRENASVFDFEISSDDESEMDSFNEGLHTTWDPEEIP